ncbi:MAG: hypothetical protein RL757_1645 [Bacteroidota bacterium]|jgi:hypothetical protein
MENKKNILFVIALALLSFWLTSSLKGHKFGYYVPKSDFEGYFMYLPATFVYGGFENVPVQTPNEYSKFENSNKIGNRFTCGVAMLMSPFYGAAMLWRHLNHESTAVYYTKEIDMAICFSACFFGALGLLYCNFLLKRTRIKRKTRLLTLGILYLGTNLLYYVVKEPLMSHVYSFCLIAAFFYYLPTFLAQPTVKSALRIGFLSAMIVLVRPSNIFLLSLFFLYDITNWESFRQRIGLIKQHFLLVLMMIVEGLVLSFPQMSYWHSLSGRWVMNGYKEINGGGSAVFRFSEPHLWQIFFHPCNGFLIYTPIMLLGIIGLAAMNWKKERNGRLYFILFLIHVYMCASWCVWWYGHAYGYRPFIDFYPILALGVGFCIDYCLDIKNNILKYATFSIFFCLVLLNFRLIIYPNYWQVEPDGSKIDDLYNALNWAINLTKW